jgi:hypothetical protein
MPIVDCTPPLPRKAIVIITKLLFTNYYRVPVIYSTVTTTLDATPLSSLPTNMPKLPTGTYALPLSTPFINYQSCFDSPSLYNSWSCDISLSSIEVVVSPVNDSANKMRDMKISINQANNSLLTYFYGSQPPYTTVEQIMTLAQDTSQTSFGTAWFFQVPYDKLVIVPEDGLPKPSTDKRDIEWPPQDNPLMRMGVAQSGEKPWFCYWNGTLLETFIYVNQLSPSGARAAAESSSRASASASRTTLLNSSSASGPSGGLASSTPAASAAPTGGGSRDHPSLLPNYPNQIKIEENRIDQAAAPYCVQMMILNDGSAITMTNSSGLPITIQLTETESTTQPMLRKRSPTADFNRQGYGLVERDVDICRCAWLSA